MHVDYLYVVSMSDDNLEKFEHYMQNVNFEIRVRKDRVLDYLNTTFDFVVPGQVSIAMGN